MLCITACLNECLCDAWMICLCALCDTKYLYTQIYPSNILGESPNLALSLLDHRCLVARAESRDSCSGRWWRGQSGKPSRSRCSPRSTSKWTPTAATYRVLLRASYGRGQYKTIIFNLGTQTNFLQFVISSIRFSSIYLDSRAFIMNLNNFFSHKNKYKVK